MVATLTGAAMLTVRDRSLILMGYAGAFRREALCAINVEDFTLHADRLDILIRRGKDDQKGKGRVISVERRPKSPNCAVKALATWLTAAGIKAGPAFRAVDRHGTPSTTRRRASPRRPPR